jgi:hypothetical protein
MTISRPTRDHASSQFSHDGERVYTAGLYVSAWQASTMERLFRVRRRPAGVGFALQPGRSRLLTAYSDGTLDLLDGATGAVISSCHASMQESTSYGVSPCGEFALLASRKQLSVNDLSSGDVVWQHDGRVSQLVPLNAGNEWAFICEGPRRQSLHVEIWEWPFGSTARRAFELPVDGFNIRARGDRLVIARYSAVHVFSLLDGRELFVLKTDGTAHPEWLCDGTLLVVGRETVDVYGSDGAHVQRASAPTIYPYSHSASPVRDDVMLSYMNGIVLIRNFREYLRTTPELPNPFAPRLRHEETYSFQESEYPQEQDELASFEAETVDGISAALAEFRQPTWLPVIESGQGAVVASKFGGVPWLSPRETWPRCGQCGGLMDLYLQLNSDDLPKECTSLFHGLLQVFLCNYEHPLTDHCMNLRPFSNASFVRVAQPDGLAAYHELADDDLFEELRIVGWTRQVDLPAKIELRTLGYELSDEQDALLSEASLPYEGDKLLGWPAWQQGVERNQCPHCRAVMRRIFQIDSCRGVPVLLGDGGRGWVLQCREHTEVVAFVWTF